MQSKAASYQLEIFFQEYMTIVEQMALDKDVRTLLTETKAGDKITESADYQTVFHEMEKIAAADSDNIQAVWLGDIDANVATQSDGFTSDSSFEITERTWYRAVAVSYTHLDVYKRQFLLRSPAECPANRNIIFVCTVFLFHYI